MKTYRIKNYVQKAFTARTLKTLLMEKKALTKVINRMVGYGISTVDVNLVIEMIDLDIAHEKFMLQIRLSTELYLWPNPQTKFKAALKNASRKYKRGLQRSGKN